MNVIVIYVCCVCFLTLNRQNFLLFQNVWRSAEVNQLLNKHSVPASLKLQPRDIVKDASTVEVAKGLQRKTTDQTFNLDLMTFIYFFLYCSSHEVNDLFFFVCFFSVHVYLYILDAILQLKYWCTNLFVFTSTYVSIFIIISFFWIFHFSCLALNRL